VGQGHAPLSVSRNFVGQVAQCTANQQRVANPLWSAKKNTSVRVGQFTAGIHFETVQLIPNGERKC
jgi:hypothetical protein